MKLHRLAFHIASQPRPQPGGTLESVPPIIRAPSPEIRALARAIIADRDTVPHTEDALLRQAVTRVVEGLDDYLRDLIKRTSELPDDAPAREGLEQALARRIASTELALGAQLIDHGAGHDVPTPDGS